MVESAEENHEPRERRQRGKYSHLHGFYNTSLFRGIKIVVCAVLRETTLTAREVLSRRALNENSMSKRSESGAIEKSRRGRMRS